MSPFNIVERIYEEEIHERAEMQVKCSEDAIRIELLHVENNRCFDKQLENQNSLGELL